MKSDISSPRPPLPGENWRCQFQLADLEETAAFARRLAAQLRAGDLLVLTGGLGAGKTTFTQALGEALGIQGQISSPTFVLSRIHQNSDDAAPDLVHVDAYRTDASGLESLDLLATLPHSVTVVEWGRGLVEQASVGPGGSWLDLELSASPGGGGGPLTSGTCADAEQPGGSDQGTPLASRPTAVAPAFAPESPVGVDSIETDFSESEQDALGTARTAVLRGYGDRWSQPLGVL
ncbi:tRNA (adenosine(37)-N6)-threonylcarbamoyltransferase complex ATPase subunit type 1 TsaE [Nesterenkonia ebinurensis]|uniref:tRNA (adenosine(37)-N6)-threonylcarbamoyltransferase complex ATPase subunit type 1 TsaE n=1 Tax=Nesterenkonia ebinurensis TaxID=2608252 RepID=UPI001CC49E71|nr:tRNA (adenosine(37)-N6)-threonylcarbamoyltransferase complex ATPase subunit type 1 TsaE [Nesterenkonia ebinurensis]